MSSTLTDAVLIAEIEIVKVSSFIAYLERNAPGLGDLAGYTSELTKGVTKQIETTGECPLIGVFEQVLLQTRRFPLDY
jgi:hypothetical protein